MTGLTATARPAPPISPFGSYDPNEVTWLLTDLSNVALESPAEDREGQMQNGGHYSESLPVEYQPDQAYLTLYRQALAASADRLAEAVGALGHLLLAEHPAAAGPPVLVSLARAGTPVGILLRRWLAAHAVDAPHYTVSIIRGKGLDAEALRYVLDRHPAKAVRFVDGWTGKGAIQSELTAAVAAWAAASPVDAGLDSRLAVLADPGHCTDLYGTRDDFLIPSACLNSTVSGLVSRTVHRPDLTPPGSFHGAKFYRDLAPADVSREFLDTITGRFAATADQAADNAQVLQNGDRRPTWTGWAEVERLSHAYGIHDPNLVKPGVGETTRVLLRRVPWAILVRPDRTADLVHVLALAAGRNVPVLTVNDLAYSCVGLIRPASLPAGTPFPQARP